MSIDREKIFRRRRKKTRQRISSKNEILDHVVAGNVLWHFLLFWWIRNLTLAKQKNSVLRKKTFFFLFLRVDNTICEGGSTNMEGTKIYKYLSFPFFSLSLSFVARSIVCMSIRVGIVLFWYQWGRFRDTACDSVLIFFAWKLN